MIKTVHVVSLCLSLVAAAALIANAPRGAQAFAGGPYQLMQHSNTTANAGVFRLDTSSGEVSYCFVSQDSKLFCSQPVK